jgi:hypothetical protein
VFQKDLYNGIPSKILRITVDAPWYIPNATLHADLGTSYVQDVIRQKCNQHHDSKETGQLT